MELKINNKETEVIFGMAFNRAADELFNVQNKGVKVGLGVENLLTGIISGNSQSLATTIYLGTAHLRKGRPSGHQVDLYVEECDDIDGLFDEVLEEFKKSNATKKKTLTILTKTAEAEKELEAQMN